MTDELLMGYKHFTWVNTTYMRPIQFGIQTSHHQTALAKRYLFPNGVDGMTPAFPTELNHARAARKHVANYINHPEPFTIIFDGGYLQIMKDIYRQLETFCTILDLPHAAFCESQEALGGIVTAVGLIAPASIYDGVAKNHSIERGEKLVRSKASWAWPATDMTTSDLATHIDSLKPHPAHDHHLLGNDQILAEIGLARLISGGRRAQ